MKYCYACADMQKSETFSYFQCNYRLVKSNCTERERHWLHQPVCLPHWLYQNFSKLLWHFLFWSLQSLHLDPPWAREDIFTDKSTHFCQNMIYKPTYTHICRALLPKHCAWAAVNVANTAKATVSDWEGGAWRANCANADKFQNDCFPNFMATWLLSETWFIHPFRLHNSVAQFVVNHRYN